MGNIFRRVSYKKPIDRILRQSCECPSILRLLNRRIQQGRDQRDPILFRCFLHRCQQYGRIPNRTRRQIGDPCRSWNHLPQQLQLLGKKHYSGITGDPRDIATGAGEVGNESSGNRVGRIDY